MDITRSVVNYRRLWLSLRVIFFFPALAVSVACLLFLVRLSTPEYMADFAIDEQLVKAPLRDFVAIAALPVILTGIGAYGWKKSGVAICAALYAACAIWGFALPPYWVELARNTYADNPLDSIVNLLVKVTLALAALAALAAYASQFRRSTRLAGKSAFQLASGFAAVVRDRRSSFRSLRLQRLYIVPAAIAGTAFTIVVLWNIAGMIAIGTLPSDLITEGTLEEFKRMYVEKPLSAAILVVIQFSWLLAVLVTIVAVSRLTRRAMRRKADELVKAAGYQPIVLLRSFQDEDRRVTPKNLLYRLTTKGKRLEEAIVAALSPLGPAVAIGLPSEKLPRLGAYRAYYDDASWQRAFEDWVSRSLLVVVIVGTTPWSVWEMGYLMRGSFGGKLIAVLPPLSEEELGARQAALQSAAAGTIWEVAVGACDFSGVSVLAFNANGSIASIRGGGRSEAGIEVAMMAAVQSTS